MELITVAAFGAVIGIAFNLLDYVSAPLKMVAELCHVPYGLVLTMAGVCGALAISAEFWILTAIWRAVN